MTVAQDYTTLALDGTEQTVFEALSATKIYSGYVYTHLMGSGDVLVLRSYIWDGAAYRLWDAPQYSGAQNTPVKSIPPVEIKGAAGGGFKVTIQRTSGTVASIKSIFFKH